MAKVFPFRALMYNRERVPDLQTVVTQPYDKITTEMQSHYWEKSPYNLVRIIRGKNIPGDSLQDNVYTRARETFRTWRSASILKPVAQPAFYAYTQRYAVPESPSDVRVRQGFIGAGQLEEYSRHVIFPHEKTLAGPKADRLELLRATHAHFEQIFMLYSDRQGRIDELLHKITKAPPLLEVQDEYQTTHSVWIIDQGPCIAEIQTVMNDKPLIIADGHHRYETALTFRRECQEKARAENRPLAEGYQRAVMTFINMKSSGLTILPTHRVVSGIANFSVSALLDQLRSFFEIREHQPAASGGPPVWQRLQSDLRAAEAKTPMIGLYIGGRGAYFILRLREDLALESALPEVSPIRRQLDVVILHQLILQHGLGISEEAVSRETNIEYVRELKEGIKLVAENRAQACFVLNPTRIDQVREISFAGETLPQKSTDFYPKLLSGLTVYDLAGGEE